MSEEKRFEAQIRQIKLELAVIVRVQNALIAKSNQNKGKLERRFAKYEKQCQKTNGVNGKATMDLKKHISNLKKKATKKRFTRRLSLNDSFFEEQFKKQRLDPNDFKKLFNDLTNILSSDDLYTALGELVTLQQNKRKELERTKKELDNSKNKKDEDKKVEEKKVDNKPKDVNLPKEPQYKPVRENSYTPAHEKTVPTVTNSRVQQTIPRKAEKITGRSLKKMSDLRFSQAIGALAQDYKKAEEALKNELLNVYRTSDKQDQNELTKITRECFQIYNAHREEFAKYISKLEPNKQQIYHDVIKEVSNEKFSSFPTEQQIKYNMNERIISNLPREQSYNAELQLRKNSHFSSGTVGSINQITKYMTEEQMIRFYKTFCNNLNSKHSDYIKYSANQDDIQEMENLRAGHEEDLVKLQEIFVMKILDKNNMKHTVENAEQILETKFNEELYPQTRKTFEVMNKQDKKENNVELMEMLKEEEHENSYNNENGYHM